MKKLILSFFCCLITMSIMAQERYLEEVFTDVEKETDIVYGNNKSFLEYLTFGTTVSRDLTMDVYHPEGDDLAERPVVITIHTGSFLPIFLNGATTGERNDSAMVEVCKQLARRGFVVANISYRLGWNPITENKDIRVNTLINAAYRGVQDVHTCVRYLKKTVAEEGNPYGIDSSRISMMGQGTGGYITYAVATLDKIEETQLENLLFINEDGVLAPFVNQEVNGTIYGFGYPNAEQETGFIETNTESSFFGDSIILNTPNHIGYSSSLDFGFAYGGALASSEWIDEVSVPFAAAHTVNDPNAPFFTEILVVPTTGEDVIEVDGAGTSIPVFNSSGANDPINMCQLQDEYSEKIRQSTNSVAGLEGQEHLWAITSQDAVSGPWDWWDPNNPDYEFQEPSGEFDENGIELTFHEANLLGNPDMSKTKALAYIDTVVNFFVPRAMLAMDLPLPADYCINVGVEDVTWNDANISFYPNPSSSDVMISTANNAMIEALEVYDIQGKLVTRFDGIATDTYLLKRNNLSNGVYIVKVHTKDSISSHKMILK